MSLSLLNLGFKQTLPLIHQSEAAECGLACLTMIANYHGNGITLTSLRRQFSTSLNGMTFSTIVNIADKIGFSSRAIKIPLESLSEISLPAILHWDLTHFVVLKSVSNSKIVVHDPNLGSKTYSLNQASQHFTGVALELAPVKTFTRPEKQEKLSLFSLWNHAPGLNKNLFLLLLLTIFLQFHVLLSPIYIQTVVDSVVTQGDSDLLGALALGFAAFAIFSTVIQVTRGFLVVYIGSLISFQVASNLLKHLFSLPIDFFEKRHMGDVVSRFNSIEPIKKILTEGIVGGVLDGIMAITTIIMMFVYSYTLGLISIAFWSVYFVSRIIVFGRFREQEEAVIVTGAKENSIFMESVRSITSIKLFGGEGIRHSLWQNNYADKINANARLQKLKIWFEASQLSLSNIELIIIVFVAAKLIMSQQFTIGMLFAFLSYRASFSSNISSLIEKYLEFRVLGLHLDRLTDIAFTPSEKIDEQHSPLPIDTSSEFGKIEVKNITFTYAYGEQPILNNASLTIESGQSVAIVGISGCGKTTLLKLMASLLEPQEGDILVDSHSILNSSKSNYRKKIGVVMQDEGLLTGSFTENISFFDPNVDMDKVYGAARKAEIFEHIVKLPMNFESMIGDFGSALSAGQKQRLAIARALYRDINILFMDEGTAHLDIDTEANINKQISQLGITRIVIAHRPQTIKSADRVFLCENGKVNEVFGKFNLGGSLIELNNTESSQFETNSKVKNMEYVVNE